MIVDQLNDLSSLILVQVSPLNWLGLHLLLRSRMGAAIAGEEFETELYRIKEDALKVWLLGNL
jgi:hypothetical protein